APQLRVVLDQLAVVQEDADVLLRGDPEVVGAGRAHVEVLRQPGTVQDRRTARALLEDVRRQLAAVRLLELPLRLLDPGHGEERDSFRCSRGAADALNTSPVRPRSAAPFPAPGRRPAGTIPRSSGTAAGSP